MGGGRLPSLSFLLRRTGARSGARTRIFTLPLFHFARMNRIPMVALNIDTRLRRAVATKGFAAAFREVSAKASHLPLLPAQLISIICCRFRGTRTRRQEEGRSR